MLFARYAKYYDILGKNSRYTCVPVVTHCIQSLPEWEHTLLFEALLPFFQVFFNSYYVREALVNKVSTIYYTPTNYYSV